MSLDLVIVRHAIAFDRDPLKWPNDAERPLTEKGAKRFKSAARGLRAVQPNVDLLFTSPLVRARQTAAILHADAGWPEARLLDALEPGRSPMELVSALEQYEQMVAIAVVGHEPGLSELCSFLQTGNGAWPMYEFRKGGAACIRFDNVPRPGGGTLHWFVPPRFLRALE